MSVWKALSANLSDVQNLINSAPVIAGDTVIIPITDANGVSWTNSLTVNKDIILQGEGNAKFETASQYGSLSSGTETIIRDDVVVSGQRKAIIKWTPQVSHTHVRMSGLTFRYGTVPAAQVQGPNAISFIGACPVVHIDNCHIDRLYGTQFIFGGEVRGVMHHCVIDTRADNELMFMHSDTWNGGQNGDNSYTDGTHWGTNKFIFIEDCCINNRHASPATFNSCGIDGEAGGRFVLRHCNMNNAVGVSGHGTDSSGRMRGLRVHESYNNTIRIDNNVQSGDRHMTECRSGSNLEFNNVFIEASPDINNPFTGRVVRCYRYFQPFGNFGGAGGPNAGATSDWFASPPPPPERNWDNCATRADGTYNVGEVPYNFDSGTATNTTTGGVNDMTMIDNTRSGGTAWTTDQWKGYTLINLNYQLAGWPYNNYIVSNTPNSITVSRQKNQTSGVKWNPGNHYVIRKVLVCLDQIGHGGGDTLINQVPINRTRGSVVAPVNQVLEGTWAWNNTLNSSPFTLLSTDQPALLQSTPRVGYTYGDFNNRAPTKAEMQLITDTPDAAFSGTTYIGYLYPHPLSGTILTPAITSLNNTTFQVGSSGSFQVTTQGFSSSPTFAVSNGTLPSGVTLNSSGLLSGTPAGGTDVGSPYTFTITATFSSQTAQQSFSLGVSATVTKVIALSGNMAFGNVTINTTATSNLSITNNGNTVLTVSSLTYPSGYSGNWASGTISPGATQNVIVTFAPVAGSTYNGNITVASDKTSGTNTIAVTGLGATRIMALAGDLAFGNLTTGQTATRQLVVTNNGNVSMDITTVAYPQGFSGDFTSGAIAAGASRTINVSFSPLAAQAYSGNVDITSNKTSGTSTIAASGTGTASATKIIQLTGSLAFGNVQTGTSVVKVLTLTNSGSATLTVTNLTLPTGYAANWTSGTIASGGTQDVNITFSPVAAITYNGTATVVSDATGGINTAAVTGAGVTPSTKVITITGNLDFGDVLIGLNVTGTMTITNTGSATLTVSGVTYPTGFTGAYSGTIAAGSSHNVTVTFSPTSLQTYGGTITVASDKTSGTNTTSTSGNGVAPSTKIIGVTGDLVFGSVQKNHSVQKLMTVSNSGTAALSVTNITLPTSFSANMTSFSVAPGSNQLVTITFNPTAQLTYGGTITVVSNKTAGINTLACSGVGSNKKKVPFFLIVG